MDEQITDKDAIAPPTLGRLLAKLKIGRNMEPDNY